MKVDWLKGRQDSEILNTTLTIGTFRRLMIVARNNSLDTENMSIDALINIILDQQKKMIKTNGIVVDKYPEKLVKQYKEILLVKVRTGRELDAWEFAEEERMYVIGKEVVNED